MEEMNGVRKSHIIAGNVYDKYGTKNPIEKYLVSSYLKKFDYITKNLNFSSALEIGGGEGYLSKRLKDNKPQASVFETDISFDITKKAKKTYKDIIYIVASADSLPFSDNSFDLVVACEVFEHLENLAAALEEMKRVSKRFCLISIPNEPIWRLMNLLRLKYIRRLGNTPGHTNHWGYFSFKNFLIRNDIIIDRLLGFFPWLIFFCEIKKEGN